MEIKVQNRRQEHYVQKGEFQIEVCCDCNEKTLPELSPIFDAVANKANEVCNALFFRGYHSQKGTPKIRVYGFHAAAQVYANIGVLYDAPFMKGASWAEQDAANAEALSELFKVLKEVGVNIRTR